MCVDGHCGRVTVVETELCMGVGEGMAVAGALGAAGTAYSANQANSTNQQNGFMNTLTNMVMQAQNQDYNSAEAAKTRGFNSAEANIARMFNSDEANKARVWTAGQTDEAEMFNSAESEKNRNFQERMSNTQYQRAIGDMKAAGLNPMLAYSQGGAGNVSGSAASISAGSGASASGSAASGGQSSTGSGGGGAFTTNIRPVDLGQIGTSALGLVQQKANIDQTNAVTDKVKVETAGIGQTNERGLMDLNRYKENFDLFIKGDAYDQLSKEHQEQIMAAKRKLDIATSNTKSEASWQDNEKLQQSAETLMKEFNMRSEFLGLNEKRASSEFFKDTGEMSKILQSIGSVGKIIQMFTGRR